LVDDRGSTDLGHSNSLAHERCQGNLYIVKSGVGDYQQVLVLFACMEVGGPIMALLVPLGGLFRIESRTADR
jgi:hypothetical protein